MNRVSYLNHSSIEFHFRQNSRDFVVEEIPLYEFSGDGEHLVLFVRKKDLSTFEMIDILAKYLGIKNRDIGYAGLKDKHALTKQYISIDKKLEAKLDSFEHQNIKILSKTYHNNKIKIGHLKGNSFFIRVKKVLPLNALKIDEALKNIQMYGLPNYYGYQRFGNLGDNYVEGKKIVDGQKKERNPKIREFLISAYQSYLFNEWLAKRVELSRLVNSFSVDELLKISPLSRDELVELKKQKHPFKILLGDLMQHYPHGRLFEYEDSQDLSRFYAKDISPTGLIAGNRVKRATKSALIYESEFDTSIKEDGSRRYAWIFLEDLNGSYKSEDAHYEFRFFLPKGSYATVVLEQIAKQEIRTLD